MLFLHAFGHLTKQSPAPHIRPVKESTINIDEGNYDRKPLRNHLVSTFDARELVAYAIVGFIAGAAWFGWQKVLLSIECWALGYNVKPGAAPNCSAIGISTVAQHSAFGWLIILGALLLFKFGCQVYQIFWRSD